MDPLTLLILLIVGYFLLRGGGGISFLGGSGGNLNPPTGIPVAPQPTYTTGFSAQGAAATTGAVNQTTSTVTGALQAGSSLAKAVPIIGAAISSLIGYFAAASQRRAAQARNENQAVANALPGWDQFVVAVATAYNNGSITAGQAIQGFQAAMQQFFAETAPQIQPDRNGCNGGAMTKEQADQQFPGLKQCSGSWGAACCVGYADLWNGTNALIYAVRSTDNTGKPATAIIPAVYASKYGGVNRPQYTLTLTRPSGLFTL